MSKFNTLSNAKSYIYNHCNKPGKWNIILGDDNLFWVVTNREASKLVKLGYEYAD